jgi:hypothetical protein
MTTAPAGVRGRDGRALSLLAVPSIRLLCGAHVFAYESRDKVARLISKQEANE